MSVCSCNLKTVFPLTVPWYKGTKVYVTLGNDQSICLNVSGPFEPNESCSSPTCSARYGGEGTIANTLKGMMMLAVSDSHSLRKHTIIADLNERGARIVIDRRSKETIGPMAFHLVWPKN